MEKNWLKEKRLNLNMTQQELANKSDICISQIRKIESGEIKLANITVRNAVKLIKALNLCYEELQGIEFTTMEG